MTRFRGTSAEAAAFINQAWAARFPETVSCPQWDAGYFDWQVFANPESLRIAAYDAGTLAGLVFQVPVAVWLHGQRLRLAETSWLSVAPALARRGVGKALAQEMVRCERAAGCAFKYGFAVPGPGSHGPRFWQDKAAAALRVGLRPWVRALDAPVLRRSVGATSERLAAGLAAALRLDRCRPDLASGVRRYRQGDLAGCGALLAGGDAGAEMRYDWSPGQLARQLDWNGIPTTLVFDDGHLQGFANFHRIGFRGRAAFSAGLINHLVTRPGAARIASALLSSALGQMQRAGLALAVCSPAAGVSPAMLLRHGFAPMPARYDLLIVGAPPDLALPRAGGLRIHLR